MSEINPADYPQKTIIHNHPDWRYHQAPGISSGAIKVFANQSPRHYQWRYLLKQAERKETEAMALGTAVHSCVLEPDKFEKNYEAELDPESIPGLLRTVPDMKRYCDEHDLSKAGVKQELTARILKHNPDAPVLDVLLERQRQQRQVRILKSGTLDRVRHMRDSVHANPEAHLLLSEGRPEVSVWAEHEATGQLVKCRADWLRGDGICVDLKTCACSSPKKFARDCTNLGYDLQDIHYTTTLTRAGLDCPAFCFIAVESEPPYLCHVYDLDDRSRRLATLRHERAMGDLAGCLASGLWPGYTDTLSTLSLSS